MRIAIVDDDSDTRATLSQYLNRYARDNHVDATSQTFADGKSFLHEHAVSPFEAVLLDVEMPGMDGFETARRLRADDPRIVIVFVTNLAQYAIKGYEVQAADYVVKPLSYYDFALKFTKVRRMLDTRGDATIHFETTNGISTLTVREIAYMESKSHYLLIHTTTARVLRIRDSIAHQEQSLKPYGFCRIHKSFLVNLRHVDAVASTTIECCKSQLPVGRAYKDSLMHSYLAFNGEA